MTLLNIWENTAVLKCRSILQFFHQLSRNISSGWRYNKKRSLTSGGARKIPFVIAVRLCVISAGAYWEGKTWEMQAREILPSAWRIKCTSTGRPRFFWEQESKYWGLDFSAKRKRTLRWCGDHSSISVVRMEILTLLKEVIFQWHC